MELLKMLVDAEAGCSIGEISVTSKLIFVEHLVAPEAIFQELMFKRM